MSTKKSYDGSGLDKTNKSNQKGDKKVKKIAGVLEENMQWWDTEPRLGKRSPPARIPETSKKRPLASEVELFREKGNTLIHEATEAYSAMRQSQADGDEKFMEQMLKAGTLADRVAAMTLRIQQSPMHELSSIDALLKLCGKGNHRGARLAFEALIDLFKGNLLPDDRVLLALEQRPISDAGVTNDHVFAWTYEAGIKSRFSQLVEHLGVALKDNTSEFRKFGMDCIADLLESKPEQEQTLLTMCVNKLGDPDRKVASRATYRLQLLLKKHTAMIGTVVQFIQAYLARLNLAPRGVYNGVVFLNQIYLDKTSSELAASLVRTYLGLFTRAVETNELKSRLLAALLTGVARAQPYLDRSAVGRGALGEHVDTLFKMVHVASFSAATQALSILFHFICVSDGNKLKNKKVAVHENTKDKHHGKQSGDYHGKQSGDSVSRFYRSLYAKLGSGEFLKTTKPTLFLNLLFKAMKADDDSERVCAFAKRLLQQSLAGPAPHAAASLFLLSHAAQTQPSLITMLNQYAKQFEHLNVSNKEEDNYDNDNDNYDKEEEEEEGTEKKEESKTYDIKARDPRGANAGAVLLWELDLFKHHFHPSIKAFADSISSAEDLFSISYEGDPLVDFSTMAFLDRIVYKQGKASKRSAGAARMGLNGQSASQETMGSSGKVLLNGELMNSKAFLALDEDDIAPEHLFFHKFFSLKHAQRKGKARELQGYSEFDEEEGDNEDDENDDDDVDDLDDEEEEGEYDESEINMEAAQKMLDADEDTDEEEREFADSLAEGMMKRHAANQAAKFSVLNNMEGDIDEVPSWALNNERSSKKQHQQKNKEKKTIQNYDDIDSDDDDEFLDFDDDDIDSDDEFDESNLLSLEDAVTKSKKVFKDSDSEDDDDEYGEEVEEEDNDDDDEPIAMISNGKGKKSKKSPFAFANEFEEMIDQDEGGYDEEDVIVAHKKKMNKAMANGQFGHENKRKGKSSMSKEEAWEAGELTSRAKRTKMNGQKKGARGTKKNRK